MQSPSPNTIRFGRPRWTRAVKTAHGIFLVSFTERGLARVEFPSRRINKNGREGNALPTQVRQWWKVADRAIRDSLKGRQPVQTPPLDWSGATPFQRKVWNALRAMPLGSTASYGELARRIGRPQSARAVGAACGANPVPLIVPCHRVLAADGSLGGFSAGLDWKRKLLAAEGSGGAC